MGPAEGSISMGGDWLGSVVRPRPALVGGPVVGGQRYLNLACGMEVFD